MRVNTPFLESERLILKHGVFNDYRTVYEYDFTKLRDIAGEFEYKKLSDEDIEGFDTYSLECDDVYDWIVYLKDGKAIGNITADRRNETNNSIELSFNLHPRYWGFGYIKEACIVIMDYLFKQGYDNIMCGYSEGNIKSKKVNEKLGFSLYKVIENAWEKNGKPITDYQTILSKENYFKLYQKK